MRVKSPVQRLYGESVPEVLCARVIFRSLSSGNMAKFVPSNKSTKNGRSAPNAAALTLSQAQQRVERHPEDAKAWIELGRCFISEKDPDAAERALEKAAALSPASADISLLRGQAALDANEEWTAFQHFERALAIRPSDFEALLNLGYILFRQGHSEQGLKYTESAVVQEPNSVSAMRLKAQLLSMQSRYEESIQIFERLVQVDPVNRYGYWNDLGNIKRELGKLDEALEYYLKAEGLEAMASLALSNQITLLHYMPSITPSKITNLCKKWGRTFTPNVPARRPKPVDKSSNRPLKIGLISDGFRRHPVGSMVTPALRELSFRGFQLYMYATNNVIDDITEKLMEVARKWTPISHMQDDFLAELIRQDGIDILIDLSGHNSGTRMKTVAMEPAPVIVKWVGGLINTTGVEAIDYLITDSVESPPGSDDTYTEKLIRMPDDYICYMPPDQLPDVRALPALENGYVTFGCFNNPTKINEVVLKQWASLLRTISNSRLYLKGATFGAPESCARTLEILASHGIASDRIRLEGSSKHYDLLACYNEVDIALDPWPYSGGLTTCEAMLMGVPVITLPGPTFAGRHSATHLINVGMPELVVSDWNEYHSRAIELASDLSSLSTIRSHLRQILLDSPVCNAPKFAQHLADALRAIWQRCCDDRAPAALAFTPEGELWFEDDECPLRVNHPAPAATTTQQAFRFAFSGRILTLDHGASLIKREGFPGLSRLGAFAVVAIDPTSVVNDPDALTDPGHIQQYTPHIALGNGEPATLFACLDTSYSGTQEPLPSELQLPFASQGTRVLTRMPIPTIRLDSLGGMDRLDWLILDDRHDNVKIIQSARTALANVLAVQIRVSFAPMFKEQCNLGALSLALGESGFTLLRMDNARHGSHFPIATPVVDTHAGSQLVSADAIFIPDETRIKQLDAESRMKLAFILHTVYQAQDAAHRILAVSGDNSADAYIAASGLVAPAKAQVVRALNLLSSKNSNARTFVGIPVYNEEQHIEETIRSLIEQSSDGLGFLVADNCSTDRTLEIVRDLVGSDDRFEIFQHDHNRGSAANLQFVLENTSSEFFMWMGGHDYLSPRYFEEVLDRLEHDSHVSMVLGMPFAVQGSIIEPIPSGVYDFSDESPIQRYLDSVARLTNCTVFQSVFRRKDLQDAEIRGVPSYDHILISHLLWKGQLAYAENARYYRRYFKARPQSYDMRISGKPGELSRSAMYDYYLDDLSRLAQGSLPRDELETLTNTVLEILRTRFGS